MMKIHSDGTVDNFTLILSKINHEHLGELTNIEDLDCKLRMNSYDELSFTLYKYVNGKKTPLWNETKDLRLVYVKELNEYFQIKVPLSESISTYKSITAISQCEAELSQTNVTLEINSEDDIARNDYDVNFPTVFCRDIDDISAYNDIWNSDEKYKSYSENDKRNVLKNSSFMHRILYKNPNYSIGHIDDSLKGLIRTFSVSDEPLYDFLSGEVSEQFNCIFKYDSVTRTISAYDLSTVCKDCGNRGEYTDTCPKCGSHNLKYYGEDTTIYVSVDNLTEEINYETDVDSIKNTFRLSAGDEDMTTQVILCNPGGEYMYYIHPELMGDMSENLQNRLKEYTELSNEKEQQYQEYVELWETAIDQKYYLEHTMMPSSSDIENGTATVSASTEAEKITSDNLSPLAVTSLKESTKAVTISNALLNYVKVYVKTGYVKVDIVENSDSFVYDKTNNTGTWKGKFRVQNYSDEEDIVETDEIIVNVNTDEQAFMKQKVIKTIAQYADDDHSVFDVLGIIDFSEFKNALKLYSLKRLQSFSSSFYAVLDILKQDGTAVEDSMYYSELYLPYYKKYNACNDEMDVRQANIDEQDVIIEKNESLMKEISDELNFSSFLGEELYKEFCSFRREDKYENQNYISDGLETPEIIDNAKKFLEQAKKEIVKFGTPQHSISSNLYNLLLIPAFKPIIDKFELGNWLRFQVDDEIYRLRLIECEFNFSDISKINVEFSTVTKTADGYNDIQSILSSASSLSSTISMVQKQAEKGENANNQIINAVQNGLDSGLMMIKSNDREEFVTNQYGIIGRSYDDTLGEYSPEELYITHNIIGFSKDSGKTLSLALGKHEYIYYDIFSNSFKTEVGYGLTSDFVQSGKIYGSDIIAGQIYSKNYSKGIKGTHFDLDNGNFELAGSKIVYDSATNKITMREVTIEWDSTTPPQISDISGLEEELNGIQNNLDQLDGRIQTYSQTNDPSVDWVTTELKNQHSGDIWVNPSDGLTKQWNGTKWIVVTDSYLKSLASSKAQIFTSQPIPPYDIGDLWVQGSNGDILHCKTKRISGSYNSSDWTKSSKYTDDTAWKEWTSDTGEFGQYKEQIKTQIDGKSNCTYGGSTPPSNPETGDLWFCTDGSNGYGVNKAYMYNGSSWKESNGVPDSVWDIADGKSSIFVVKPNKALSTVDSNFYHKNDIWILESDMTLNGKSYKKGSILTSTSDSTSFVESHWIEKVRYTDDTTANEANKKISNFQQNVNKLLNANVSTTEIGSDYVFSPYIGGGYLYIKNPNDSRSVTIDPQQTYSSDGYIFRITDKTGNTTIGADSNGNAFIKGDLTGSSGTFGKDDYITTIGDDGIKTSNLSAIGDLILYDENKDVLFGTDQSKNEVYIGQFQVKPNGLFSNLSGNFSPSFYISKDNLYTVISNIFFIDNTNGDIYLESTDEDPIGITFKNFNYRPDISPLSDQLYSRGAGWGTLGGSCQWMTVYSSEFVEDGTALSDKYVPIVENHPVVRSYGNETSTYIINEITHVYDGSSNNYMEFHTSKNAFGITAWVSDTKLKKNIVKSDVNALDKINQINMVQFNWKTGGHVNLGVSANQLEEIIPDAVFEVSQSNESEYDTLKNVNPNIIIPYCLKAIQELSCEIDKLKTQLVELNRQTEN